MNSAIVGYSFELPKASSSKDLWTLLSRSHDACEASIESDFHDNCLIADIKLLNRAGLVNWHDLAKRSCFQKNMSTFVSSPITSVLMDVIRRALKSAKLENHPELLKNTSVYFSSMGVPRRLGRNELGFKESSAYSLSPSMIAGWVSHTFGIGGSCTVVESACSSSLTALSYADRAIKMNIDERSIIIGLNVLGDPLVSKQILEAGALSNSGYCRPFDINADGYVRGEGAVCVILEEKNSAKERGFTSPPIILGTHNNHNAGRGVGYNGSSVVAQSENILAALSNAKVQKSDVSYVEAHATGTLLGDPIELRSLSKVFNFDTHDTLPIGSIKSNIGHLEGAAGLASLVKSIEIIKRKCYPPVANFQTPTKMFDFENSPLTPSKVSNEFMAEDNIVILINSLGLQGSNSCMLIGKEGAKENRNASKLVDKKSKLKHVNLKYRISWKQKKGNIPNKIDLNRQSEAREWLIVSENKEFCHHFSRRLKNTYPKDEIQFVDKLEDARVEKLKVDFLIYVPNLLSTLPNSKTINRRLMDVYREIHSLSRLTAHVSLRKNQYNRGLKFIVVTVGGNSIGDAPVSVNLGAIQGFIKILLLEHYRALEAHIDVPPSLSTQSFSTLIKGIRSGDLESTQILNDRGTFVPRLEKYETPNLTSLRDLMGGKYLVTGGSGYLGQRFVKWLIRNGASEIHVLDIRNPTKNEIGDLKNYKIHKNANCKIIFENIDVGNINQFSEYLKKNNSMTNPFAGIVHAAGYIDTIPISKIKQDELEFIIRAKVVGAVVLHEMLEYNDLKFFVLSGSASSIWGAAGMGAYAAANGFLDNLSIYRRSLGLPSATIAWSTWDDAEQSKKFNKNHFEKTGLKLLSGESPLDQISDIISVGESVVSIADADWDRFKEIYSAHKKRNMFDNLTSSKIKISENNISKQRLCDQVTNILTDNRPDLDPELIMTETPDWLDIDSLEAVELALVLSQKFSGVSAEDVISCANLGQLIMSLYEK